MVLNWSSSNKRAFRKTIKKDPSLKSRIITTMRLMENDPFDSLLKTHKLKGVLADSYACSIDYNYRLIINVVKNPVSGEAELLLIDIGTHDEVY